MKKLLFIDRDGTLVMGPEDYQVDDFSKLKFYPNVFRYLSKISDELSYDLIMVTNQDGLGTDSYPEATFWPIQNFIIETFQNEGIQFQEINVDRSFPSQNLPTRKPNIGMLLSYLNNPQYDIENSFVIGDRLTDVQLAKNLGCIFGMDRIFWP